jgi:choline dehydrogenase-like flavoprotein
VDRWGIPVLRFHFAWSENDVKMAADMNESFSSETAGGTPISGTGSLTSRWGHLHEGGVAHEVGTVRMGSDPKTSALNGFCQAHDVKNLFVTDGASFTTNFRTRILRQQSWRCPGELQSICSTSPGN